MESLIGDKMKYKKGVFVNYQIAEAIKLLDKYDISDDNGRKLAETELQGLKDRWTTQDKIPGYGIIIGNKNAGMEDITLDEISKFATDIKQADTYSTECIGNMQYCLVRDENGNVDFDFSYLSHIADLARANRKQLIIDSAVVFGDRFPENMANMSQEEVANVISIYIQKLTREFGDCIERIDVLNSVFQRDDVFNREGTINSEEFWINVFGEEYARKVLSIVRQNCQNPDIDLCWNEFYITNQNTPEKKKSFLETISNTADLDVVGLQDNFRADTSCQYIQDSLEEIAEVCRKCGKKISITELSCKVGRRDIESLNEAKQSGNYATKIDELNNRIRQVIQTATDFCQTNPDIVSSVESRYSDRYDCNYRECKNNGHIIYTSPRRDNNVEQTRILTSQQDGKSGFNDCMQDDGVRISTEQGATQTVKNTVLNKDKVLDVNEHNIQE